MTTYNENDSCKACRNITLAVFMFLTFVFAIVTNFMISTNGDTDSVSAEYVSPIMASDWAFVTLWSLIYVFQFLWMLYLLILTIKFASRESLFSTIFYISFIIINLCNAGVLFFWNKSLHHKTGYLFYASISCMIMDIALYVALFSSMRSLLSSIQTGLLPDWVTPAMHKVLVVWLLNGVGLYFGYVTYLCNFLFAEALQYHFHVSDTTSSIVAISMMGVIILIYSILNFVLLDKYFASLYSVLPAIILCLTGVVTKQGVSGDNPASIVSVALLGVASIVFIAKIVINCIKAKKHRDSYGILDYSYDMASI